MFFEIKFFFYGMYWQNKDNIDGYVKNFKFVLIEKSCMFFGISKIIM